MVLDLYGQALALTSAVNPLTDATLKRFVGIETGAGFKTLPRYETIPVQIEVQALATSELQLLENIQQQSDMRAVYLRGAAGALNRPLQQGGDLLAFDGTDWLITQVLEDWGDDAWRKVICTRQCEAAPTSD